MRLPNIHNVDIEGSDANMLAWGELVLFWIRNPGERPGTVALFNEALERAGVDGRAKENNAGNRVVEIQTYEGTGNIIIPVPSIEMVEKDWDHLNAEWEAGNHTYPIPEFYRFVFQGSPAKRSLTKAQIMRIAKMRLGEYVINECM